MDYVEILSSPVGPLTIASSDNSLIGLWLEGQKHFAATLQEPSEIKSVAFHEDVKAWLNAYFAGKDPGCSLPLSPRGTEFQKMVWRTLEQIPYGKIVTYGEIAHQIEAQTGRRSSPRAVGGAVGRNPLSIIIPCHRVVGAQGTLIGYAGGIDKKKMLLELEQQGSGRF